MKHKYVMIEGLAFSEEMDMEKLKNYASQGWILEDIVGGFFYKLRKDKPQNIVYTVDYQIETNEEYFTIFKEAGWKPVVSVDCIHIFSAQAGTKPIYSDCESEIDKYTRMRNRTKKGSLYSLLLAIVLMGLLVVSFITIRPIFLVILGLLIIDIVILAFNFMPYLEFDSRVKQIKKYGKCRSKTISNKILCSAISSILFLTLGIKDLIEKNSITVFGVCFVLICVYSIFSCFGYLKNYKKSL
ncbi:MAG: DUF2812 domain-containing protein [Faecalibacillus intestinalis]